MDKRLQEAVKAASVDQIVAAVRGGADVNGRDDAGETALTYATSVEMGPERAKACIRTLLRLGARVSEERPRGGLGTSVHGAAAHGYTEALRELLAVDGKSAFGVFDDMSRTPLICAVQSGNTAEASLLLDAGADPNTHDSARVGNTALIAAVQEKNVPMVRLLMKHGADPTIRGWMQLSALDRSLEWARSDASSEVRDVVNLLQEEARRRTTKVT